MPKPQGWFSRRYQTAEKHIEAQQKREAKVEAYFARFNERVQARANRTPAQQIAMLDQRLGKGKGAKRERARLEALIKKGK